MLTCTALWMSCERSRSGPTAAVLERARDPLWAVLPGAPPDDQPMTAEDMASIENGRQQPGMMLEDFRTKTA